MRNPVYIMLVLGYAAQTFVTGAVGFYGIQYVQRHLGISNSVAGMSFGGVTVVCGFAGTALGGWLLDRVKTSDDQHLQIRNAMKLIFILSAASLPCCVLPFLPQLSGAPAFFLFIAAGELLLFGCYSPINSAIIWSVPYRLGPLAVAMSSVGLHVLGDAISAPILGLLLDRTDNNWNLSFFLVALWLSWTLLFFGIGWQLASKKAPALLEPLIDVNATADSDDKLIDPQTRPSRVCTIRLASITLRCFLLIHMIWCGCLLSCRSVVISQNRASAKPGRCALILVPFQSPNQLC